MQVPRDLRRRMLEAVDQVSLVDVYERLSAESERVSTRCDLLSWLVEYAGDELVGWGLDVQQIELLGDVQADPAARWALFASFWPLVRTTGTGRMVLRMVWAMFGIESITEQTWREIAKRLWNLAQVGFYGDLCRRANIRQVWVDGPVEPGMRPHCVPVGNYGRFLMVGSQEGAAALSSAPAPVETLEQVEGLLARALRSDLDLGMRVLRISPPVEADSMSGQATRGVSVSGPSQHLAAASAPSPEEVSWAWARVLGRQASEVRPEPALYAHFCQHLLDLAAHAERGMLCLISAGAPTVWYAGLARRYPQLRFVIVLDVVPVEPSGVLAEPPGVPDPLAMLALARMFPNVSLAVGNAWRVAPGVAREALHIWLRGLPLHRLLAWGGGTTMIEGVFAQASFVREQVALLLSEMVAAEELDEDDALSAMGYLLGQNALAYVGWDEGA